MAQTSKEHLKKLLNRFTLQDICNIVLQEFPEITWEEIQDEILQNNAKMMSKDNVIKIILKAVNNLPIEVINKRASKVELYYIGETHMRTWNVFRLKNKIENFNEKANKLDSIKNSIRKTNLLADTHILKLNGKYIISVVKKAIRKHRGISRSLPVYLQFFPPQPYIFISKGKFDTNLISSVIKGLGYNNYEYCHLYGPNVCDLLTLIRNKEGGVCCAELMEYEPDLEPEVRINDVVTNYSQSAKRAKYAEQIYGKNPPQLQQISIAVKDDTWNTCNNFTAMEGTSIKGMELSIQSTNVIELFKEMIIKGVIPTPIPPYIQNILSAGKNKIKINPEK